ncbi:MAG: hypothetical protein K8T25_20070 [Planctomycetia bacterium]|nr:hypothetical protein [Planctomycetia bacterium]
MTPEINAEQREALERSEDLAAIREGIADMEAGRVLSLEELDTRIQAQLRS